MKYYLSLVALFLCFHLFAQDDYFGADAIELDMSLDYTMLSIGVDAYLPVILRPGDDLFDLHPYKRMLNPSIGIGYEGWDNAYADFSVGYSLLPSNPQILMRDSLWHTYDSKYSNFRLNFNYIYYFSKVWGIKAGITYNYMVEQRAFRTSLASETVHHNVISFRIGLAGTVKNRTYPLPLPVYEYFDGQHFIGVSIQFPLVPLD